MRKSPPLPLLHNQRNASSRSLPPPIMAIANLGFVCESSLLPSRKYLYACCAHNWVAAIRQNATRATPRILAFMITSLYRFTVRAQQGKENRYRPRRYIPTASHDEPPLSALCLGVSLYRIPAFGVLKIATH